MTSWLVNRDDLGMEAARIENTAIAASGGNRLRWHEIPAVLRFALADALGAAVVAAESRHGGFSPGLASVLTLEDGRTVFAKAINATRNEFTVEAIRTEGDVLQQLPLHVPAPRLLWTYDDGEWVALVTEAIDGHNPVQPWRRDELDRFLAGAIELATALTPSPIEARPIAEIDEFRVWAAMAADPAIVGRLAEWIRPRLRELADLDARWPMATAGDSLMHGDLRADNVVLTPDGRFVAVDWPSVLIGPAWLDLLVALPSIAMHGGGDPEDLWSSHPFAEMADPDAVDVALAGFAGLVLSRSMEPAPPLLPTIRDFQRVQGEVALRWLFRRLDRPQAPA
ncbi:MAG TPA: aminoglycoside phosphotransferase family protein [Micromonosporaceae bacterium]